MREENLMKGKRSQHREGKKLSAKLWVNWQVSYFNYLTLGCPKARIDTSVIPSSISPVQRQIVSHLLVEARHFCAASGGEIPSLGRGRAHLRKLIARNTSTYQFSTNTSTSTSTVAEPIDLKRIAMPTHAGRVQPHKYLCPERAKVLEDLNTIVLPEDSWPLPATRPCQLLPQESQLEFVEWAIKSEFAVLIPEEFVPRNSAGKLLVSGLFAVPHTRGRQRLIVDRRPQNEQERQLNWMQLPHGTLFCRQRLRPSEALRGSGDDLECYFYQLAHQPNWWPRQCCGKRIRGADVQHLGGDPRLSYRLAVRVVCMGDANGTSIAQGVHEGILQGKGCMRPGETLRLGFPVPDSDTWEGAYLDDHLVTQKLPRDCLACHSGNRCKLCNKSKHTWRDEHIVRDSCLAYEEADCPRSEGKSFRYQSNFESWGTAVQSHSGRVSACWDKVRQNARLIFSLLTLPQVDLELLQCAIGGFVFPFMHRRELMCNFHRIYSFMHAHKDRTTFRLPPDLKDELLGAILTLPLASSSMRAPVSQKLVATDSTPTTGGACSAHISASMAHSLFSQTQLKGELVRLDWTAVEEKLGYTPMARPTSKVNKVIKSLRWGEPRTFEHSQHAHINLQEMRAYADEIVRRASQGERNSTIVCCNDSRVVVGAVSKGRSSSIQLNGLLRKLLPVLLACNLCTPMLWLATDVNPADYPSRHSPLPAPTPLDSEECPEALASPSPSGLCHPHLPGCTVCPHDHRHDCSCVHPKPPPKVLPGCTVCHPGLGHAGSCNHREHPPECNDQVGASCARAVEYFSGEGGLNQALNNIGIQCDYFEAFPKKGIYVPSQDLDLPEVVESQVAKIRAGKIDYAHFGIPCSTWGQLALINGGSRRAWLPYGEGLLPKELRANRQLQVMAQLIAELEQVGACWSIENPGPSYIWLTDEMQHLILNPRNAFVRFHQCMYHLRPPEWHKGDPDHRVRKDTYILSNISNLHALGRLCDKQHVHTAAIGSVKVGSARVSRAKAAGAYPPELCRRWARLVSDHFREQGGCQ